MQTSYTVQQNKDVKYTCQLSRLRRESHACGLKTSISRLRANFSRLIEKCELLPSCLTQFSKIVYCNLKLTQVPQAYK